MVAPPPQQHRPLARFAHHFDGHQRCRTAVLLRATLTPPHEQHVRVNAALARKLRHGHAGLTGIGCQTAPKLRTTVGAAFTLTPRYLSSLGTKAIPTTINDKNHFGSSGLLIQGGRHELLTIARASLTARRPTRFDVLPQGQSVRCCSARSYSFNRAYFPATQSAPWAQSARFHRTSSSTAKSDGGKVHLSYLPPRGTGAP